MRFRLAGALAMIAGLTLALACGGGQKKQEKKQTQSEDTEAIRKAKNEKATRDADCAVAIMKNAQEGTPIPADCQGRGGAGTGSKDKVRSRVHRPSGGGGAATREQAEKAKVEEAPPPKKAKPSWVDSGTVNMPDYYVGIGEAAEWEGATTRAFDQIGAQIKVTVKSEARNVFREKSIQLHEGKDGLASAGRTEERTDSDASLLVDQTLEGVEIHERYSNGTRFWILARLSKAKLKQLLAAKLEAARDAAISSFKMAEEALARGDVGDALRNYVRTLTALRTFQGGQVKADVNGDGKDDVLNALLYRSIQQVLAGLKLTPKQSSLSATAGAALSEPLQLGATYKDAPAKRLPLRFDFSTGSGKVEQGVVTDDSGQASAGVSKVFGKPEAVILAKVNLEALCDDPRREYPPIEKAYGKDLDRAVGKFRVSLGAAKVFVKIIEKNLGQSASAGIAAAVKDVVSDKLGLTFTDNRSEATMAIEGAVDTGQCKEFYEQRKCKATARISVKDLASGQELFSKTVTASGTDPSSDKAAGLDALAKVGSKIGKTLAQKLKK